MKQTGLWMLLVVFAPVAQATLAAAERYYEENGVTYRETRQVVRRPVSETRIEDRQRVVYQEQVATEYRDGYRVYRVPVTEYHWETRLEGMYNPFVPAQWVQRLVPRTRWETRTEVVQVPVVERKLVPITRVERVPVTSRRLVEDEVVRRVAVSGRRGGDPFADNPASRVASRTGIGGVARLDDPPRHGGSDWRASTGVTRR